MPGKILWIDDTPEQVRDLAEALRDEGYTVNLTSSASEGASLLAASPHDPLAVIVDLLMDTESFTVPGPHGPQPIDTLHGLHAGLVFGRWAKRQWPFLNIIGVSVKADLHDEQVRWFRETGAGYFDKYSLFSSIRPLLLLLNRLTTARKPPPRLRTSIIHGRDTDTLEKLRTYLKTNLRIPELITVREESTPLPELFAEKPGEPEVFNLIFAILATTDPQAGEERDDDARRRSRENILFETGFAAGQCAGGRGKVIILHTGDAGLPADAPGASFINISAGLEAVDEQLRREIVPYLVLLRGR